VGVGLGVGVIGIDGADDIVSAARDAAWTGGVGDRLIDVGQEGLILHAGRRVGFFLGVRAMELRHPGNEPELPDDAAIVVGLGVGFEGVPIDEMAIGNICRQIDEGFL
jgi:hypothetical protein